MSDFGRLQELARAAGVQVNPPSVVDIPMISPETAAVGDTLSCTMGNWNGEPENYAYSWMHAGDPAEIGAGASYTTVAGDADSSVCCVVTATNNAGSATASPSNAVTVTAGAARAASEHHEARRDRK